MSGTEREKSRAVELPPIPGAEIRTKVMCAKLVASYAQWMKDGRPTRHGNEGGEERPGEGIN